MLTLSTWVAYVATMVDTLTPYEALLLVIERLDGKQSKLAKLCEVSSTAVSKWVQSSKRLPAEYAIRVEAATGVDRRWLAPAMYPHGLIDGVPYNPEEPTLDIFSPIQFRRAAAVDTAQGTRFEGADRRVASL